MVHDNLTPISGEYAHKVRVYENVIEIYIDPTLDDLSLYIFLFSYINFRYFIVEKILLLFQDSNGQYYRNISFIQNFSYIDFKIWWSRTNSINYDILDTRIYLGHDTKITSFLISLEVSNMKYYTSKFGLIELLTPIIPLKRTPILKEIMGDFGNEFIDTLSKTSAKK